MPHFRTLSLLVVAACIGCDANTITGLLDDSPPDGYARVTGIIKDQGGTAVQGATVMMPYGQNQYWGTNTDSKGKFKFDARAADFVGVAPVAVVVFKDRYLPRTYYLQSVAAGNEFDLAPDAASSTRALLPNEFVPTNAHRLWHVGNDDFGGSANSQLQTATTGTSAGFPVTAWNAQMRALYHTATVTLVARGIETTLCPGNRFGFYSDAGTVTAYVPPGNSDAGGGFSTYQFNVALPATLPDGNLMFAAIAGTCGSATNIDDWEFAEVMVTLKP